MLGVNVVVFDEHNRVLLIQREDFEVWCTPGGLIEKGETPATAGIREAKEETGLDVRLTRFVGVYSRDNWRGDDYHIFVFAGEVIGGTLTPQEGEALQAGFFALDQLPELLVGQDHRIKAAAAGIGGSVIVEEEMSPSPLPDHLTRWDIYRMRDESGLPRTEFYHQHYPTVQHNKTPVPYQTKTGDPNL
jgi:ADP-ribose pyrophosphatase YjhB (NUDIX family)